MKFLGQLLALLLAAALTLTISGWIFGQTFWSAGYLERQADQTNLYPALATGIQAAFATENSDAPKDSAVALDPAPIQKQFTAIIPQFINHFYNSGPAPVLDLVALAAATGQPAPQNTTAITLNFGPADTRLVGLIARLKQASEFAPIAAVVLIGLIVVTMGSHRLRVLARASIEAALTLLANAALLWFVPNSLSLALNKPTLLPIRTAISPFVTTITHDIATRFMVSAAVFILLAVILWLSYRAVRLKAKFAPKPKPSKTNPPTLKNQTL